MSRSTRVGSEAEVLLDRGAMSMHLEQAAARLADLMTERLWARAHPFQQEFKEGDPIKRVNQYGGKVILKSTPSESEMRAGIREQATLIDWVSPDRQPHHVSIDIGRILTGGGGSFPAGQDSSGNNLTYRARAQVFYGTPSAMQTPFFVDINRGQKFIVCASYIAVTPEALAVPTDPTGKIINGTNGNPYVAGSLSVFANLGIGVAIDTAPLFITQYADSISAATTFVIPEKANRLMPVRTANGANITIDFFDNAGTKIDSLGTFPPGAMVAPCDLSQDVYKLVITPSLVNTNIRLIYQLSV